ncbi:hypothetical protein LINGRAHAP2_LOCUS31213 [Linum grandiflorum]
MRSAFGSSIRGSRVEGSGLRLGRRSGSEHLGRSSLVVPDVRPASVQDVRSDCFQKAEGSRGHHVGGVVRDLEGDGDVRLSGEVVDFVRANGVEPAAEGGGVGEISVMELHPGLVGVVGVDVDVVDSLSVEVGGPPDEAVNLVALVEEELGEVGAVLAGDSGDQSNLDCRRRCVPVGGSGSGIVIVGSSHGMEWNGGGELN